MGGGASGTAVDHRASVGADGVPVASSLPRLTSLAGGGAEVHVLQKIVGHRATAGTRRFPHPDRWSTKENRGHAQSPSACPLVPSWSQVTYYYPSGRQDLNLRPLD